MDCFNFITILLQQQDTSAEADGERNSINQKLLLSVFKATGAYSKYAIEMFVSIAQVEWLLIALTKEFKRGFFLNWNSGEGNNIEDNLAQLIQKKLSNKEHCTENGAKQNHRVNRQSL